MTQEFDPFDPEDWGDKPGCTAFETALEMRNRGALAAAAVPVLEAHLAACDACRDHAARLRRVEASLVVSAPSPDARRLRAKLDAALNQSRRAPWVLTGIGIFGSAAVLSLFGGLLAHHKWLLLPFPLLIASGGLASYTHVIRLRRLLAEPDTVAAYRRWLQGNLKRMRRVPWVLVLNGPAIAFPMRSNWHRYAAGNMRAGVSLFLGIFAIAALGVTLFLSWRQARQISAELAQMH
ncbi:MAG: hypothetical protein ABUS79_05240 [Pseudomonadota bacterium]